MAIKTVEELMNSVRNQLGGDTSDSALTLIEDISDTMADLTNRANSDPENWEQKYKDNDAEWRKRYHDRFFSGSNDDDVPPTKDDEPKLTFESLFGEKKG